MLSEGVDSMKPTRKEFFDAYVVIMAYIDDEPNSRKLFHSLLSFGLGICNREEEELEELQIPLERFRLRSPRVFLIDLTVN